MADDCCIPGVSDHHTVAEHMARYRFACRYAKAGMPVLDVGCGEGYGAEMLASTGATVYGIDVNSERINRATTLYLNVGFRRADLLDVPMWPVPKFGLVVCCEVIEHIRDYSRALRNLYRLTAPGGTLILSTPNRIITSPDGRITNQHHAREFTWPELHDALGGAGFMHLFVRLYGQRHQPHITNRLARKTYRTLFKPEHRASPEVTPCRPRLEPQYLVVVCQK